MTTLMTMIFGSKASNNKYRYEGTVVDTTGDTVILENTGQDVLMGVIPGTSATVQYTLSSLDKVKDNTAVWYDWPNGSVTEPTQDSVSSLVTALRLVSVGTSNWEVVA